MFLEGFGIGGYRSFGELQKIGPLKKVNLFIGQNNSGKSNVLSFLNQHYRSILERLNNSRPRDLKFDFLDRHLGENSGKFQVAFGMEIGGQIYTSVLNHYKAKYKDTMNPRDKQFLDASVKKILQFNTLTDESSISWFLYDIQWVGNQISFSFPEQIINQIKGEKLFETQQWDWLFQTLTTQSGGNIDYWIPEIIKTLGSINRFPLPAITLIPAIRKIGSPDSGENDYSGNGIIEYLAKFQNPTINNQNLREKFQTINKFLQEVTDNQSAVLDIPHDRSMIIVHMDGKTLPLSSLGTGIHEVVILAAAATVLNNQILCIEEPELHLHPLLQKKLLKYLQEKTDNQYFITTHSAHLLDTTNVAIFHVQQQNKQSIVTNVTTDGQKVDICADLGYKASDLLQANCILWVEGPSDRIYLKHWINCIDSELIEGLHYSIMYYGGRLLSNLTADDIQIKEFISLRRLNRYISILIDSDRSSSHKHLNETKKRIKTEFDNNGPGFAWITQGREIENYIVPDDLEKAVMTVHPTAKGLELKGQFDNCLKRYKTDRTKTGFAADDCVDKVRVAQEIVKLPANLEILDLKEQITKLVKFIHTANGLGVSNN